MWRLGSRQCSSATMRRRARIWLALVWALLGIVSGDHAEPVSLDNSGGLSYNDPTTSRSLSEQQFDEQVQVANYITVASLTLYAWEYLRTLPRELYMYRMHMIKRPQVILFLLIRYGTIPALIVPAYSLWHHFKSSDDCPRQEQITVAVVQFLVACIFSWRTIAIWRRRRWVIVFLVVFSLALFATSVGLLYQSKDAVTVTGACRPAIDPGDKGKDPRPVNTVKWFYLISMIFETVTMVLSSYKLVYYANMGRSLDMPVFKDPFEEHRRRQKEKEEHMLTPNDESNSRRSSAADVLKRVPAQLLPVATFPYHAVRGMMHWWSTLTPLLARLISNGLVYFFVATAFNVVNFVLEEVNSIHSKSFLTLYAPLMCVMCQNMILTEFDAVWSTYNPDFDIPGRRFVHRVVGGERRLDHSRLSELDRFQEFVNDLEQRHASSRSSASAKNGTSPTKDLEAPPPVIAVPPEVRRPSQVSFVAQPRIASVDTLDTASCESPRVYLAPSTPEPHTDTPAPAPRAAPSAPAPAPVPPSPAVTHGDALLPQLSKLQQQQALRMAGLR